MSELNEEVQKALSESGDISLEEIATEDASPLNQPVKEKDIAQVQTPPPEGEDTTEQTQDYRFEPQSTTDQDDTSDAPEQEINPNGGEEDAPGQEEEEIEIPIGHATQAADAFLGMADNLIEVGGGFFIKIKKHKDFYDFEEILQVVDEQNAKNIKRIKLDEEDKALLRPLLIVFLRKRAVKLTPEQQLLGALISIIVKKAQVVMEIKSENEMLVERILEIIKSEKTHTSGYEQSEADIDEDDTQDDDSNQNEASIESTVLEVADEQ